MDEHRATAAVVLGPGGRSPAPTLLRPERLTLEERIDDLERRLDEASRGRLELSRWCAELESIIQARAELFEAVMDQLLHVARAPSSNGNGHVAPVL